MLKFLRASPDAKIISPLTVADMSVTVKIHPRARRMTLRYSAKREQFILTVPKRAAKKSMQGFITENEDWMRRQLTAAPETVTLRPGGYLPLEGRNRLILHQDMAGVQIELTDDTVLVKCRLNRFPRALQRFVQQRAYDVITPLCQEKAALLGRPIRSIQLRDTVTRWGSCTSDGRLSFSWRLILAPIEVIDYVVAHEVAHLKIFDHSTHFWKACRDLTPHTTFGKHWLKQNGSALHLIKLLEENSKV